MLWSLILQGTLWENGDHTAELSLQEGEETGDVPSSACHPAKYSSPFKIMPLNFKNIYFIYLTLPGLSCSMWNLVPWSGIEPGAPCVGSAESWPLNHQGGPWWTFFFLACLRISLFLLTFYFFLFLMNFLKMNSLQKSRRNALYGL